MPFIATAVSAIAGAIGGVLAAGGIGAALVRLGGTLLLSYASQALMPKPALPKRTVTVREPVAPRELVYGRARKGGTIVFLHATGRKDKQLHLVIVLATHRVQAIGAIWFDGEMAIDADGVALGRWANRARVSKRLGAEDQASFAALEAELAEAEAPVWTGLPGLPDFDGWPDGDGGDGAGSGDGSGDSDPPPVWTADHRLAGCAAIYLRLTYDADAFPGGIPGIAVDITGKADILDPRSGARGYSENPALCLADYMAHPSFGIGAAIGAEDGIDVASLIEAANICDEPVALAAGGTEPRYSCNGVVSLAQSPKTVIEAMLTAMAGRCAWGGGAWRLHAGAYRLPAVTLTPDDARAGGLVLATRISRAESFNAVRGQFISPENDWQPDDFPAVTSAVYRLEDGGETVWRDLSLPFTISAAMAQRLAKIELERARRQMTVRLSGKLSAWRAAVGETVLLDHPRWGFVGKPFEVHGVALDLAAEGDGTALLPELVLRETSPALYDWEASEEAIYAAAPRTRLPSAWDVPPPGVPEITEALYVTRDGTGVKALARLAWAAAPSGFVQEYRIEARRIVEAGEAGEATATWTDAGRTEGLSFEIRDIAPGPWEFRLKAVSALGVSSPWVSRSAEIVALSDPPAALVGLTLQSAGGLAILKWQRAPEPDVRLGGAIVIRHSTAAEPSWAASCSMDRVAGGEAIAVVPLKPGTYLLRAEDSGGRLGPVALVSTKGLQALPFGHVASLVADPGFGAGVEGGGEGGTGGGSGAVVVGSGATWDGVVAEGGGLMLAGSVLFDAWPDLDAVTSLDWQGGVRPQGVFTFGAGLDFGAPRLVRLRSEIALGVLAVFDRIDGRANAIDLWSDFDGAGDSGGAGSGAGAAQGDADVDVTLEIRHSDDDPAAPAAVWTAWSRVDASEIEARAVEARARLFSRDPGFSPRVTTLRLHADEVS